MSAFVTKRVLVLNQDYSPVTICSVQKAFLLVFLRKAELVSTSISGKLRTVNLSFPLPAVVRLHRYVNMPYKGVMLTRQNVFKRDGHQCQYCGTRKELTIDHLIPRSKGGGSDWANLVTACKRCNARKGDYSPEEAGMKLARKPFKPTYIMFIRDFSGFVMEEWLPYLQSKKSEVVV